MRGWALLVVALYAVLLAAVSGPVLLLLFAPEFGLSDLGRMYSDGGYWIWIGAFTLCQAALLVVPVRAAEGRPVTRRSLLWVVVTAGLMFGVLTIGASLSVIETLHGVDVGEAGEEWTVLAYAALAWAGWSVVFHRATRDTEPSDVLAQQCRLLYRGSVLELLIAVPAHVVARVRDYCCAGFLSGIGIAAGISVMLVSFGPAALVLFAARWRQIRPADRDLGRPEARRVHAARRRRGDASGDGQPPPGPRRAPGRPPRLSSGDGNLPK